MSSEQKFRTMLEMQIATNDHTVPGWREKNLAWRDAIWIECAELMEHIGWKWWKKQEPNLEQARMELVDIWHFGMSLDIDRHTLGNLTDYYCSRMYYIAWEGDIIEETQELIRVIAGCASQEGYFHTISFFKLMNKLGMTLDDLYTLYVGKNVLNKFRQDNGYKEGTYQKLWGIAEDNEVLSMILRETDPNVDNFPVVVRGRLESEYEEALAK